MQVVNVKAAPMQVIMRLTAVMMQSLRTGMRKVMICKSVKLLSQSVEAVSCQTKIPHHRNCVRTGKRYLGKVKTSTMRQC